MRIVRAIARRVYAKLPAPAKSAVADTVTARSFASNTAGLAVGADTLHWVAAHRRPVSIVIPSYNDFPLLAAALASVETTCADFDYEVIVVDDYCQEENSALLRTLEGSHNGRVRVIFKEERKGFAVSVNVGMAAARYDIVLLNSDIVAQPGWLDALQHSAYNIDPKIGMVSPKLVYPDGRIQYAGTYYARVLAPQWFGHLYVGSAATRAQANVAGYNRSISGACVYITAAAYAELGSLDENFWLGFEDVDYGLTAWTRGIRCYYEPASLLIHHESASRGYSQGQRELASMRYFWRKWQPQFLARTVGNAGSAASTTFATSATSTPSTTPATSTPSATSTPPATSTTAEALAGSIAVQLPLPRLDYIVSERSPVGWAEFVTEQAARLAELGHTVAVHHTNSAAPDEALIELLSGQDSLKVAADWGAGVTTWLASLETGKPVYLLPTVESGAFPADPATQAKIVAQYRPEFEYVAPNRWTADQLRAETAWESAHRVVPALRPQPLPTTAAEPVVATVGLSPELRTALGAITRRLGVELRHFDAPDGSVPLSMVEQLRNIHPRAIVSLVEFDSALSPLALMSLGAAFIGRLNDKTRYEVLDGYNALLVAPGAVDDLERALTAVMTDDSIATELAGNGFETAERFAQLNPRAMSLALVDVAQTSV